jgi:hypothetical protein
MHGLFIATGLATTVAVHPLWAQTTTASANGSPSGTPEELAAAVERKAQLPPAAHLLNRGGGRSGGIRVASPYGATIRPEAVGRLSVVGTPITFNTNKWEFVGPRNLRPASSNALGPTSSFISGRVNGVAYDPINTRIAYVASDGGGLWRVDLITRQWTALGETFPMMRTSCVAVHPYNNKIIYVGLKGLGLMRSANSGATFTNIGQQLGNVSDIAIDPENPSTLLVASDNNLPTQQGRRLWRSTDNGNTWSDVTPTLADALELATEAPAMPDPTTGQPPRRYVGEGFQDVKFSAIDPATGGRTIWATARRAGLFRSDDRGVTWVHVNAPLVYNPVLVRGTRTGSFIAEYDDRYAGGYACHVAPSATDSNIVYVMDTNTAFANGTIWKSTNRGASWTEITGTYPANEGPVNNWTVANLASYLEAVPTAQISGSTIGIGDMLYGATRTLAASPVVGPFPFRPDSGPFWTNILPDPFFGGVRAHINQRDLAYLDGSQMLLANDGGVYGLTYNTSFGTSSNAWSFDGSLNAQLHISQFNEAAFHPTDPNQFLGGLDNNEFARSTGDLSQWVGIPFLQTAIPDSPLAIATPPSPLPPTGARPVFTVPDLNGQTSGGAVAYDPVFHSIQYAMTANGNQWPNRKIFITANNWAPFPSTTQSLTQDITPDRFISPDRGNTFSRDSNGGGPYFIYPQVYSQDSGLANNWRGERKSPTGVMVVGPSDPQTNTRPLYTGGTYLWRYDAQVNTAAATVPEAQSFLTTPFSIIPPSEVNGSNRDYGRWRRVGGTELAPDAGDYITAIAVYRDTFGTGRTRIYVGTHHGRLWMMQDATRTDSPTRPTVPAFTSAWESLNGDTLPSFLNPPSPQAPIRREITSISVNTNRPTSDILVSIAGAGVYRAANTTAGSSLFQPVNGLPGATLPTFNANSVTRDPADPDNTFYVGTDLGIFTSVDQGSRWSDAGQPLGLPNVAIRRVEAVPGTGYLNVATIGRGIWRFNLNPVAVPSTAAPVLNYTATFSRSYSTPVPGQPLTSVLYVTIKVTNTGGAAADVRLSARLAGTANTVTLGPVSLGTIAAGGSKSVSLTFPGTVGMAGSSATLTVNGTYGGNVPGTFGSALRTRLP